MKIIFGTFLLFVAGCGHSSEQYADDFTSSPPVATRLDVAIGERIPPALCFQQDGLVLVVPDCGGCGSDIDMVRSVRSSFSARRVSLVSSSSSLPIHLYALTSVRRLFGPQEYGPMLIQVRGGTVHDVERDPQLFSRLKP